MSWLSVVILESGHFRKTLIADEQCIIILYGIALSQIPKERRIGTVQNIESLPGNYKQWIIQELQSLGWDDDNIEWAMLSGECKFCEDNNELKDAIKELWNKELTDTDLEEYILNNSNHIIQLYDEIGISYIIY